MAVDDAGGADTACATYSTETSGIPVSRNAFMQSAGLVNDHLADCWVRDRAGVTGR